MSDRGVSSPIGVILILGMTIAAVTSLLVVGGTVIDETRADAERSQMENAMSQFSSKASLVGLGESGDQAFDLGRTSEGDVSIRESAGNVSLYVNRTDGDREYIANVSMGSVVYQNGQTKIAYQGGGVWKRSNGHSQMVSPPEYHYKLETLTFPIINVTGSGAASGQVQGTVHSDVDTEQLYPNPDKDFTNPLENGTVYVEIESDYCTGWESFFRERSSGSVESCDTGEEDTVVVDLSVPFDPAFGAAVTSKYPVEGGVRPDPTRDGVVAPSASSRVEDKISDCGGCSSFSSSDDLVEGTYYTDDASDFNGLDIDATGNVEIVVDDPEGVVDVDDDIDIDGLNNVSVFMRIDSFSMNSHTSINEDGNASQLIMYMHSDVSSINFNSHAHYKGGIYAPNTVMQGKGNGGGGGPPGNGGNCGGGGGGVSLEGSVVVENFCFNAGNTDFSYEPKMGNLDVNIEENAINYLHVSENTIEINVS